MAKYDVSIDQNRYVDHTSWPYISGADNPKATYAMDVTLNGQKYTFIPDSTIQKGVTVDYNAAKDPKYKFNIPSEQYYMPWFMDKNNLASLGKIGQKIDLADSNIGDYIKNQVGSSSTGVLVPAGSIDFDSNINKLNLAIDKPITGLSDYKGTPVYAQGDNGFIDPAGGHKDITITHQDSGNFFDKLTSNPLGLITDTAKGALSALGDIADYATQNPLETAALVAAAYYGGPAAYEALSSGAAATPAEAIAATAPEVAAPEVASAFTGALPAGAEYVAPTVTDLGTVAGTTDGMAGGTALSDIGATENAYTAAQDAQDALAMTGNPAANASLTGVGAIGAANANPALNAAAAGDVAAAGGSTAAALKAAGAGALGGAAAGTALSDILPYTAGAGLVGSALQAQAAQNAANQQTTAAQAAAAQQQTNFNTINAQQAPYRTAGYNALNEIAKLTSGQTPQYDASGNIVKDANGNPVMTTGSGYLQHQFNAADLKAGLAPNYDFMLQQGQMANQRAANLGGGALGGNALQGLQKYTQDYASNAYQNAFNNYQNQRNNIYNTLASIAGIGQTGQTATNTAATNATNAATQLGVGSAAAQAAGTTGSAAAYGNAINNAANNYTLASLLNQRGNAVMPVQG